MDIVKCILNNLYIKKRKLNEGHERRTCEKKEKMQEEGIFRKKKYRKNRD